MKGPDEKSNKGDKTDKELRREQQKAQADNAEKPQGVTPSGAGTSGGSSGEGGGVSQSGGSTGDAGGASSGGGTGN